MMMMMMLMMMLLLSCYCDCRFVKTAGIPIVIASFTIIVPTPGWCYCHYCTLLSRFDLFF